MERRCLPISWQLPAYDQQAPGCPDRLTIHAADFGFTLNDLKAEFVPTPSGTSLAPRRAWSRGGPRWTAVDIDHCIIYGT